MINGVILGLSLLADVGASYNAPAIIDNCRCWLHPSPTSTAAIGKITDENPEVAAVGEAF